MSRLPPIEIAGRPFALPLSEPTASVLLLALLCGDEAERLRSETSNIENAAQAALAEALTLDPALTLWAAVHHARAAAADAVPPSIVELAAFLMRELPSLLTVTRAASIDADLPGEFATTTNGSSKATQREKTKAPKRAVDPRRRLAELATANVLAAQRATPAGRQRDDARYLTSLLQSAPEWLADSEPDAAPWIVESNAAWLGWLTHSLGEWIATPAPPSATRKTAAKSRGKSPSHARPGVATAAQRALGQTAGDRWLVPVGIASRQFHPIAARLLRTRELESNFAETLLEEKLHALGEFAAGAGHEINNPLAVISGRAQLFLRHEADPERRRELAVINTQARRVHEMIADLMLFARPPQPRPTWCDIAALASAVVRELAPQAAERNITLSSRAATEPIPEISADATQLQVALRAVIENALDATPDGGAVEVAVELRDGASKNGVPQHGDPPGAMSVAVGQVATEHAVAITVRDGGPGIDAAARRNLFDPFYSGRGAGRGVGMGLSKCWRIVTGHGGRVEIENLPTGGAGVTILLPFLCDAAASTALEEQRS